MIGFGLDLDFGQTKHKNGSIHMNLYIKNEFFL